MPLRDEDMDEVPSPYNDSQKQEWLAGWYDGLHSGKARALDQVRRTLRRFHLEVDQDGTVTPRDLPSDLDGPAVPGKDNPAGNSAYDDGFEQSSDDAFARMIETIRPSALGRGVFLANDGAGTTVDVASALVSFFCLRTSLPDSADLSDGSIAQFMDGLEQQEISFHSQPGFVDGDSEDSADEESFDDSDFSDVEEDDVMHAPSDAQIDREIEELEAILAGNALESLECTSLPQTEREIAPASTSAPTPMMVLPLTPPSSRGRISRRVAMVAFLGTLASVGTWALFRTRDPEPTLPKKLDHAQLAGWVPPASFSLYQPATRQVLESIDQLDYLARQGNMLPWLVQQAQIVMQDPSADGLKTFVVMYVESASKWEYAEAVSSGLSPSMCNAQMRGSIIFTLGQLWSAFGAQAITPLVRSRLNTYIASNLETDATINRALHNLPSAMLSGN